MLTWVCTLTSETRDIRKYCNLLQAVQALDPVGKVGVGVEQAGSPLVLLEDLPVVVRVCYGVTVLDIGNTVAIFVFVRNTFLQIILP